MRKVYKFLFILLLIGFFLAAFFHPITAINVDLGRHLLLGDIISKTHQAPKINLLSYTYPDFFYINTSWLTEVLYHYVFVLGGFNSLLVFNTFLIAFAFGILVFYAVKKYPSTIVTLFGVTLYLLLLGLRPDIRPEVMSMFFLSLFIVILFSSQEGNRKKLWLLVPLEIFWVNMHIYFFVGPLLIALFLLDNLLKRKEKMNAYVWVLAGTIFATVINPNGVKGVLFPFTVLQNYGLPVIENQSILTLFVTYHSPQVLLPLAAIFLLFIILFFARKHTKPIDWLLALVFSLATVFIFRNVLLFVFATFVPFISHLNYLSAKYYPVIKKLPPISYFLFYPVSLLILFLFIVSCVQASGFGFGIDEQGKPAVDFLLAYNIQGPIYNNFDIGDYLAYRIYPQKVFVDNRPEAYPAAFFKNIYIPMQTNPAIFRKVDQQYRFNAIVISHWDNTPWSYPLLRYLVNDSRFKLIYLDAYSLVLVRDTHANKSLISKYLVTEKNVKIGINNNELVHFLFFFEKVGWKDKEVLALSQMRKQDSALCILTKFPIDNTSISAYISNNKLGKNCL